MNLLEAENKNLRLTLDQIEILFSMHNIHGNPVSSLERILQERAAISKGPLPRDIELANQLLTGLAAVNPAQASMVRAIRSLLGIDEEE